MTCSRTALTATAALLLLSGATLVPANAAGKLTAEYNITFAGISVGNGSWTIDIGADKYEMTAKGSASGVVRAIASGDGSISSQGTVKDGRPVPATFVSSLTRDDEKAELKVTFDDGKVTNVATDEKVNPERIPVTGAHRTGVLDPISALLIPAADKDNGLAPDACNRTLAIFDGKHRFDLKFAYKRMDKVKADKGYSGPVVVCTVAFTPVAGHRPKSTLIKFLSEKRDIEAWYAPIEGARLLAPFKLSVASMLGSVVIQATTFETGATQRAAR
jgi:hypothetical protein